MEKWVILKSNIDHYFMASFELRDLFIDPRNQEAPPKWDAVTLNLDVEIGDYRIIRSKVGNKLIITIKYEMIEDTAFLELGQEQSPSQPTQPTPRRWSKMYRCWFNLGFTRNPNNPDASPISREETVEYPEVFPEEITKEAPEAGKKWPKDPAYRLYKNYKYPDPTPPEGIDKCDSTYTGQPHVFAQKSGELTIINVDQKIRKAGEQAPPASPGGEEAAEEVAKMLKNYLKTNDIKGDFSAKYKILTVKQKDPAQPGGEITCSVEKFEEKNVWLRSLGLTEDNKGDFRIVDLPIVRY